MKPILSIITVILLSNILIGQQFHLYKPYTFNPTTIIKYSLSENGFGENSNQLVHLSIHDLLGRRISILVNERKTPGEYEITFNSSNLRSGIYFYRLEINGFSVTKKMMLIK